MKNKTKKQYIKIGLTLFIIILIFAFFFRQKELPPVVPQEENYKEVEVGVKTEKSIEERVSQTIPEIAPNSPPEEKIKIFVTVLNNKYDTEIKKDSFLIEAMKKIELESINENKFSFKYTDNYSLGSFITEINGVKGTPGKYWIYYVNGESASVGVSNYILKNGDIINWSQEGM